MFLYISVCFCVFAVSVLSSVTFHTFFSEVVHVIVLLLLLLLILIIIICSRSSS